MSEHARVAPAVSAFSTDVATPLPEAARGSLGPAVVARSINMKRWAVLVGISEYKAPSLRLSYAHRDVEKLWELLQTNACGAFVPERTKILVNKEATTAAVTKALRSFLKDAGPEDLVLIHFSGHGAEDPSSKNKIYYLLTYDTDPQDLAGTALPMREIMQSIDDYVKAKRIVMLMDTCHSAAVEGGRGGGGEALTLERYQTEQQRSQEGFAIFTSSEANEASRESSKWGNGHGLFSHLIIEGLRGKADKNGNGIVTLGELFDYVEEQTRLVGGDSAQHPRVGSKKYDRDLVVAVTGGMTARPLFDVGMQVYRMAVEMGDKRRFAAAARYLSEADDMASLEGGLLEARVMAGVAWLGAGEVERACLELWRAVERDELERKAGRKGCPEAGYYLGIALAKKGEMEEAAKALATFAENNDMDRRVHWARQAKAFALERAEMPRKNRVRALLIGIGRHAATHLNLKGPENDVRLLRELLCFRFYARNDDIVSLCHEDATLEGMQRGLEHLRDSAEPEDVVVVSFSGHATSRDEDVYLVPHDGMTADDSERRGMSAVELHQRMNEIPAKCKLLILDTHPKPAFITLARGADATYSVLLAASPGETTAEVSIEEDGQRFTAGVLSYAFTREILRYPHETIPRWGDIMPGIILAVRSRAEHQNPMFIGSESLPFLADRWAHLDVVTLFETSLFGCHGDWSTRELGDFQARIAERLYTPLRELHLAFGRALVERGALDAAENALRRAAQDDVIVVVTALGRTDFEKAPMPDPETAWALGLLQGLRGSHAEALAHFRDFAAELPEKDEWIGKAEALLAEMGAQRTKAVLVGIDEYTGPEVPTLADAVADAERFAQALIDRCGLVKDNILVLSNERATTEAIRSAFRELAAAARECPALFYFAGNGSAGARGPTLVGVDARKDGIFDLGISELVLLVGTEPTNLACIFDTDFEKSGEGASRFAPLDLRVRTAPLRDLGPVEEGPWLPPANVGRTSIFRKPGRPITDKLVETLRSTKPAALTWAKWAEIPDAAHLLAEAPDEPLFTNATGSAQIQAFFRDARRSPWKQAAVTLGRLIDEGRIPRKEGNVDLGVTHALLGDPERAVNALKASIAAAPNEPNVEASYHLGRVLLESGLELGRAQAELEAAAAAAPNDPTIQYYLGAAIRAFLEKESLERVRIAWKKYLDAGAPLGHREEVEAFLTDRRG